jgi:DNA-binding response OmpR family regulator
MLHIVRKGNIPSKGFMMGIAMDRDITFSGNILVADDEKVNVDFFQVMLTKLGFSVDVAYSGEEVLEKLENFSPDLIILDLLMPRMSGFQVAKKLKANSRTREIPIIILTAVSDIRDKVDMLELGIEDYIMKPFNFIEILARIRNVLRVGALRDELRIYEKKLELLDDYHKNMQLFLDQSHRVSRDIVETGEKELKKKVRSTEPFAHFVVETGRAQIERIELMKCRYRELVQDLYEEEEIHAHGRQEKDA